LKNEPIDIAYKLDLDMMKANHRTRYLGQTSFPS